MKALLADLKECRDVAFLELLRDVTGELGREISDVEQAVLHMFFSTGFVSGAEYTRRILRGERK